MLKQLWRDESGAYVSLEIVLAGTILGIGVITGLSSLRDATITELADVGGAIALVKNGDSITIDARKRKITLDVPAVELKKRRAAWKKPKPRYTRGVLAKYASHVSSASTGAVTDKDLDL